MNKMVAASAVRGLIDDAMLACGLPAEHAAQVADLMLEADLIGADAHGVFRLTQYVQRLKIGAINPDPTITVTRSAPATALVDGDNGMGHVVVARAAETARAASPGSACACRTTPARRACMPRCRCRLT